MIDISLEYARPRYLWMPLTAVTLPVLDVRGLTISKYLNPKVQMYEMYELIDCRDSFTKIILNIHKSINKDQVFCSQRRLRQMLRPLQEPGNP